MDSKAIGRVFAVLAILAGFFFLFRWCIAVLFPALTFGQTLAGATLFTALVGAVSKDE